MAFCDDFAALSKSLFSIFCRENKFLGLKGDVKIETFSTFDKKKYL